jgi:TfoX/Sxy family transcriptional regulator of competence genes
MSYDEALAARVREAIVAIPQIDEKAMFGGVAFLLDGKMFAGIVNRSLMVRVGLEREAEALTQPHVRPMDFTGRPMRGYVFVDEEGCSSLEDVERWTALGMAFTSTLPAKAKTSRTSKATKRPATGANAKATKQRDDAVTSTSGAAAARPSAGRRARKTPPR